MDRDRPDHTGSLEDNVAHGVSVEDLPSSAQGREDLLSGQGNSSSSMECCDGQCLGGCHYSHTSNTVRCNACRHYFRRGGCVSKCPQADYKYKDYFCIERTECLGLGHKLLHAAGGGNTCVPECPDKHKQDTITNFCLPCRTLPGGCSKKVCRGAIVSSLARLQQLNHCTTIDGPLIIRLPHVGLRESDWVAGLGAVEVIRAYLVVEQTPSLLSLGWLANLRQIAGRSLFKQKYALHVHGNSNLTQLWPGSHQVIVSNGDAVFVSNPRLCPATITALARTNNITLALDGHLLRLLNGDELNCNASIEDFVVDGSDGDVVLSWRAARWRALGYYIHYRELKQDEHWLLNTSLIYKDGWSSFLVGTKRDVQQSAGRCSYSLRGVLRPGTLYALYLETLTASNRNFRSEIKYVTTLPSSPSAPGEVSVRAVSSSSLDVLWTPALHPNGRVDYYRVLQWATAEEIQDHVDHCQPQNDLSARELAVLPALIKPVAAAAPPPLPPVAGGAVRSVGRCSVPAQQHRTFPDIAVLLHDYMESPATQSRLYGGGPCSSTGRPPVGRRRTRRAPTSPITDSAAFPAPTIAEPLEEDLPIDHHSKMQALVVRGQHHLRLSGLHQYTPYRVQVLACNFLNESCRSGDAGYTTDCGALCSLPATSTVVYTALNSSADTVVRVRHSLHRGLFSVRWSAPSTTNGRLQAYHLFIYRGNITVYTKCVPATESHVELTEALEVGSYVFSIRTQTSAGRRSEAYTGRFTVPGEASIWAWVVIPPLLLLTMAAFAAGVCYRKYSSAGTPQVQELSSHKTCPKWLTDIEPAFIHPRDKLKLEESHLGIGYFGVVRQGELELQSGTVVRVAVKKLKKLKDGSTYSSDIMQEAKLMLKLCSAHVVQSYGVVCEDGGLLLVLELMTGGNLQDYLCSRAPHREDILTKISIKHVLSMAAQVADGMLYLTYNNIVHRDLAARNCLLDRQRNVKVSDFGLSRSVEQEDRDYYQQSDCKRKIPFRWMPPEFFERGINSLKSDVWSYGVLLWEIMTGGSAAPYGELVYSEVKENILSGKTLLCSVPASCPRLLKELMHQCWSRQASQRPHFHTIISLLLQSLRVLDTTSPFLTKFQRDAFYFTRKGQRYGKTIDNPTKLYDRNVDIRTLITIPPPPDRPLPQLPTLVPAAGRPTSLPVKQSAFNCWAEASALNSAQFSPDAMSPASTVSTVLSPASIPINDGNESSALQETFFFDRIRNGFASIQGPFDSLRSNYNKINFVKTKEKESKLYTNSEKVVEQSRFWEDHNSSFLNPRIGETSASVVDEFEYQDMRASERQSTPNRAQVWEESSRSLSPLQEESTYAINPKFNNSNDHNDELLEVRLEIIEDPDNCSKLPGGTLADSSTPAQSSELSKSDLPSSIEEDDTLDVIDLASTEVIDQDYGLHHVKELFNPSITDLGIDTPPSSRNNSVGSNQTSNGCNISDLGHTVVLNIIGDPSGCVLDDYKF